MNAESTERRLSHPDPKPVLVSLEGEVRLSGWRCDNCGRPSAVEVARCPRCLGGLSPASFGPGGTVWSSTVVRVDTPGHHAPYALAYVDVDEGPRILAHVAEHEQNVLSVGGRVELTLEESPEGDVSVKVAR